MGRGERKNQGEGHIFKAEIFQSASLTTCTFQNASASGGKHHDPYIEVKSHQLVIHMHNQIHIHTFTPRPMSVL